MKICKMCKNEVPNDSKFCQYCGSSEIIEPIEEKKQESINDNKHTASSGNSFFIKMILVISLVFNVLLIFNKNENKENQNTANDNLQTKYNLKAKEYDDLVKLIQETKTYKDFYVDQNILVRPKNQKVLVTLDINKEFTIYNRVSSEMIEADWGECENGVCELFVTGAVSGTFYVDITNSEDDRVVKILIINE